MQILKRIWAENDGVLSFEWTLVVVLLTFGIVSGVSALRDVIIDELGDQAAAVLQIDQSYSFVGIPALGIPGSDYDDELGTVTDCSRQPPGFGIAGKNDAVPDGA